MLITQHSFSFLGLRRPNLITSHVPLSYPLSKCIWNVSYGARKTGMPRKSQCLSCRVLPAVSSKPFAPILKKYESNCFPDRE